MKATLSLTLTLLTFVTITFISNSFAQEQERPIVKVIYFIPNDRSSQPDIDEKLISQVKNAQKLFADLMEAHGFERKTFRMEEDAEGNVVVHHRRGSKSDTHYRNNVFSLWFEFPEESDLSTDFYIVFFETDTERPDSPVCGLGFNTTEYKGGLLPSSGQCFEGVFGGNVIAHELAHGFWLSHDNRSDADAQRIWLDSIDRMITTYCAAAWLDAHPVFNPGPLLRNQNMTARMLEPEPAAPPNYIRIRFEISDPDGMHMVKLLSPTPDGDLKLHEFKELLGVTDKSVEFVTNKLPDYTEEIFLSMLDVLGNFRRYRFELTGPLPFPPEEDVHIPDPNLAAAVQEQIGESITTLTMLILTELKYVQYEKQDLRIKDLTGLEHAYNLRSLKLENGNQINDISPIKNLTNLETLVLHDSGIKDISLITNLTNLKVLRIGRNEITDISPLTNLIYLKELVLSGNQISDISPLTNLTNLSNLSLGANEITDISPLRNLTNLSNLSLSGNEITDISPIENLTNLHELSLAANRISDISPIKNLTNLKTLNLRYNEISDIRPISNLTNLERLILRENQISDVEPLIDLENLKVIFLNANLIKDRKPLLELLRKNPDMKIYIKNDWQPLPVTLSHFRAEHTDAGVILKWTTESEVDNAGFYIYRSRTKDEEFKVVNPNMIQGAGTTGERNEYMWTDTTAKPNTVYFYRIEDISHAGERQQLATVRLRGLISARGKMTTQWANFKTQE